MFYLEFFVRGHPVPKQSFRVLRKGGGYIAREVRDWQERVRRRAEAAMQGRQPLDGGVEVELDFVLEHNRRVDLDNLSKSVLDALRQVAYRDDTQIVHLHLHKHGGNPPGVYVLVSEAGEEPESEQT
jgi:Holliday junction resolvase RusA-like endonuclease